jgi:hypothetical protein
MPTLLFPRDRTAPSTTIPCPGASSIDICWLSDTCPFLVHLTLLSASCHVLSFCTASRHSSFGPSDYDILIESRACFPLRKHSSDLDSRPTCFHLPGQRITATSWHRPQVPTSLPQWDWTVTWRCYESYNQTSALWCRRIKPPPSIQLVKIFSANIHYPIPESISILSSWFPTTPPTSQSCWYVIRNQLVVPLSSHLPSCLPQRMGDFPVPRRDARRQSSLTAGRTSSGIFCHTISPTHCLVLYLPAAGGGHVRMSSRRTQKNATQEIGLSPTRSMTQSWS